jgi:hypothetical protein
MELIEFISKIKMGKNIMISMKDNMLMAKEKVMEDIFGGMEGIMRGNGRIIFSKEKVK